MHSLPKIDECTLFNEVPAIPINFKWSYQLLRQFGIVIQHLVWQYMDCFVISYLKHAIFHHITYLINIYELISVCPWTRNIWVFSETAYSSQTKLIGLNLPIGKRGTDYSKFDPWGPPGPLGVRGQIWIAYSVLRYMKVKPYQFGLATISSIWDHLELQVYGQIEINS